MMVPPRSSLPVSVTVGYVGQPGDGSMPVPLPPPRCEPNWTRILGVPAALHGMIDVAASVVSMSLIGARAICCHLRH
jgi:hypothetical protein